MKKILQTILFLLFTTGITCGQDIIYTVSGELNNQKVPLDSIMVENLSNNTWMTFNNLPDEQFYQINLTKKAFWGTVGINDLNSGTGFIEVQNLPGFLVLSFIKNTPERINFSIYNVAGQKIYSESNKWINPGNSIKVQPGATGVYLVKIETPQKTQSFKVIGQTLNTINKVEILDGTPIVPTTKSATFSAQVNFAFNIGDSIRVSVFKSGFYSFPEKSKAINTMQVNFQLRSSMALVDGISDAYFPLDEISTEIESFNNESGVLQLGYSGQIPNIREGNIITVDLDTIGYLRKVTKVTETSGKLTVNTKHAALNELFVEKNIKINTELITPDNILKSSSNMKISEALTDKDGYIHPVEIIYQLEDGSKQIISAFTKSAQAGDIFELFRFNENFKMDLAGTKDDELHFYIDGNVSLIGNAFFEFDFKYKNDLSPDTKIKEGDLEVFSYFLKLNYNSVMKLALDMKINDKKSGGKKVWDRPKVIAKFLIGTVPLWITFDLDFYASYLMEAEVAVTAQWGLTNSIKSTVGGSYHQESGSFVPINDKNNPPKLDFLPFELTDKYNLKTRFELYPRIDAMFYSFAGPYVELVPNLKTNLEAKAQETVSSTGSESFMAWNSSIDAGLDLRSGFSISFLDEKIKEFTPLNVTLLSKRLWEAPDSLSLESEIPGVSKAGDKIRLTYKVFDNLSNPLAKCPVVFKDDEGLMRIKS